MRYLMLAAVAAIIAGLGGIEAVEAKQCRDGTIVTARAPCPPPPPIKGEPRASKKFLEECTWLPFPVGKVGQPIVFFRHKADARCIGRNWRRPCPDCQAWIEGKRGPVNGPAKHAVIAIRLHNNMSGVSVPRESVARIRQEAGWCWFGRSGIYESHHFFEFPF